MYYDDANPKFLDLLETAAPAYQSEGEESGERTAEERTHRKNRSGTLAPPYPFECKSRHFVGELRVSECDSYTDYHDYRIERAVILGFSTHTRNLFSEMRKYAANFEGTAYLAENDKEYEHRENYSMGGRYVFGTQQV